MVKPVTPVILLLFLTCLFIAVAQQQPPPILSLQLAKNLNQSQNASTYIYYSSTFNTTRSILALTLNPSIRSSMTEFLSFSDPNSNQAFTQYPNDSAYTHKCTHSGLNTCILDLTDPSGTLSIRQVTLYFSVIASQNTSYSVLLELIDDIQLVAEQPKHLSFAKSQAAVLHINGSEIDLTSNLDIMLNYSKAAGSFDALAAFDAIPHTALARSAVMLKADSAGAYNKKLSIPPIENSSDIYVLIQSEIGNEMDVTLLEGSPELTINSTITQMTSESLNYSLQLSNTSNTSAAETSLYLQITPFSGYGSFSVDYCFQSTWQLQSTQSMSFQIVLSPEIRNLCLNDSAETMQVSIINPYSFGYSLTLLESSTDEPMLINQQILSHAFANQSVKTYPLSLPTTSYSYFINYTQSVDNSSDFANGTEQVYFSLQQCQTKKKLRTCSAVANSSELEGQLIFTSNPNFDYELIIDSSFITYGAIGYQMLLGYDQVNISSLAEGKVYRQEIALREYKFYHINLTALKQSKGINFDYAQLNITVNTLNGNVDVLSSLTIPDPTIDAYMQNTSLIRFELGNTITYIINSTVDTIYVSAYGQQASLFQIQFAFDPHVDLPIRYASIQDDIINTYTLNKTNPYVLLSFQSHIKPYNVTIQGNPKCIRYGHSLPLPQACFRRLPTLLYEKTLFLNISNGKPSSTNFNFTVTASSGHSQLTFQNSIVISCSSPCYSIINATLKKDSRVIMKGKGQIQSVDDPALVNVKDMLTLACSSYPCSSQINASLAYGGVMHVFLLESELAYLDGTEIRFTPSDMPKNAILPLSPAVINDVILRSDGLNMAATYSLLSIDSNNENVLSINFTSLMIDAKTVEKSNPLRNVFIFTTPRQDIVHANCQLASIYCVAVFTFLPNLNVPYSLHFISDGSAILSSSSASPTKLPINQPLSFNSTLQLFHFQFDSIANDTDYYRIDIEPSSSCHPVILSNNTQKQYNYGPMLFNGQQPIQFAVMNKEACQFAVCLTNSVYQSIVCDRFYTLQVEGEVTVVLNKGNKQGFVLRIQPLDGEIEYILLNGLSNSYDAITTPTLASHTLMATHTNSLKVQEQRPLPTYVIRVITNSSAVTLLADSQDFLTLLPRQQVIMMIEPASSQIFQIISRKSISISISCPNATIIATVGEIGSKKNSTYTFHNSKLIQFNNDSPQQLIINYQLTILNPGELAQQAIISYQQDNRYLSHIYESIIAYDAFAAVGQQNCYNYQAPLVVGRENVAVDFVLDSQKYENCSCLELQYEVSVKAVTGKRQTVDSKLSKLSESVHAFRLEMEFVAGGIYTLCLSTPNSSAINKQYYVLVNAPDLSHISQDQQAIKYAPERLDRYEIVEETDNQTLMVQLTACQSSRSQLALIASPFISDYILESNSSIADYSFNNDSVFAKMLVRKGYYFLGVKSDGVYALQYSTMDSEGLLPSVWQLESKEIMNITTNHKGEVVITLPKLASNNTNLVQGNITLTYHIFILNTTQSQTNDSFAILARCPNYVPSKAAPSAKQEAYPAVINQSITFTYGTLQELQKSHDTAVVTFQKGQISNKFNITGRAEVHYNNQSFSYYYSNTHTDLAQDTSSNNSSSNGGAVAVIIIILIIMAAAGIYAYIRYKKAHSKEKVDFELANFGENSGVREKGQGLITTPKTVEKGYYEMNDEVK